MGIFHLMRWDVGRSRSVPNARTAEQILEDNGRQPTVSTRRLAACKGSSHASVHLTLTRTAVVPLSRSVCAKVSNHTLYLQDSHSVEGLCNGRQTTLCLQQQFYSRANRSSLGLGSPTFTTNIGGQMKIVMRFCLTISIDSFPSTCGLELQETAS
jgi:hypothetical protein